MIPTHAQSQLRRSQARRSQLRFAFGGMEMRSSRSCVVCLLVCCFVLVFLLNMTCDPVSSCWTPQNGQTLMCEEEEAVWEEEEPAAPTPWWVRWMPCFAGWECCETHQNCHPSSLKTQQKPCKKR